MKAIRASVTFVAVEERVIDVAALVIVGRTAVEMYLKSMLETLIGVEPASRNSMRILSLTSTSSTNRVVNRGRFALKEYRADAFAALAMSSSDLGAAVGKPVLAGRLPGLKLASCLVAKVPV